MNLKEKILCFEAKRWQGVTEVGGDNKGQVVEMFQRIVGDANGESWCVSFVQYCIRLVDSLNQEAQLSPIAKSTIPMTESVVQLWRTTPQALKGDAQPGRIVLWEHTKNGSGTGLGHAGIVVGIGGGTSGNDLITIEGNTSPSTQIEREGDGVYLKRRPNGDLGSMKLLGFIKPWG